MKSQCREQLQRRQKKIFHQAKSSLSSRCWSRSEEQERSKSTSATETPAFISEIKYEQLILSLYKHYIQIEIIEMAYPVSLSGVPLYILIMNKRDLYNIIELFFDRSTALRLLTVSLTCLSPVDRDSPPSPDTRSGHMTLTASQTRCT